jgi:hypothetical protein
VTAQLPDPSQSSPGGQLCPQPPQLPLSVWVFVQKAPASLPQRSGVEPAQPQAPPPQISPPAQAVPQLPQFAGSEGRFAQNDPPSAAGQAPNPASTSQIEAHWPEPLQTDPNGQEFPQVPQLAGSVESFAQ